MQINTIVDANANRFEILVKYKICKIAMSVHQQHQAYLIKMFAVASTAVWCTRILNVEVGSHC